jgi:hypothetical protein
MSWGHPLLAVALPLGVLALWALQTLFASRARHRQRTVGAGLAHLTASVGRRREQWRSLLLWSGALAMAVSLGAPRWGSVSVDQHQNGADILLLLDCSRSMLTRDIYPTRMEAARRKALDLLEQAPELRLGLMPFAAVPILRCPFTGDHGALEQMLKDCSPELFPADQGFQGTAIGDAVTEGLHVLSHGAQRGQALLIMSDGADDDHDAVEAAAKAAHDAGIPVFGLFFGDSERKATLTIDGQAQTMSPDRATLETMATRTGGLCVSASRDDSDVLALIQRIEKSLKLGQWESHVRVVQTERYQWPLAVGILLLCAGALAPTRRRAPRATTLQALASSGGVARAARVATLTLALIGMACAADPWEALSQALSDPPDHARSEIEALLLEHPAFYAAHYDLGTLLLDKDPTQAIAHLREATVAPDLDLAGDSYLNLALALLNQGRLDEALVAAASASQLKPALAEAVNQLRAKVIGIKDEARRTAEEEARKLHLATSSLPAATVHEAYSTMLSAAGGSGGGYRFDPLPSPSAGFQLEADGRLHGTPDKVGHQDFSVTVHDAATSASRTLSLEVLPPPEIIPERLPEAILGQPYHAELMEHGLNNPIWNSSGLPAGLILSEIGAGAQAVIEGHPQSLGTSQVTITAGDGLRHAARTYQLVVSDSFAPDVLDLPNATSGAQYRFRPGIRGPGLAYSWAMSQDVDGLQLASDGTVSGIPQNEGPQLLPIAITASDSRVRQFELHLLVNPPPVINEEKPITVTAERPVQQLLHVQGGTPPYQWQLSDGTLPQGLRLDPDGSLRGATTAVGDATVTVALQDRWQAAAHQKITITVKPAPPQPQDQKDQNGKDQQGKDQQSKDQDGKDQQGKDQQSKDQDGKDQQGKDQQSKDQDGKDQQGKDQSGKDQQSAGGSQQPKPGADQNPPPKDQTDAAKNGPAGNSGDTTPPKPQDPGAGGPQPADAAHPPATPSAATEAAAQPGGSPQQADPARAAAVRWLEALPDENHDALRGQLLRSAHPPTQKGNPW